ncbi:phage integrase N-terminal SAM-like domain-containing protein [Amycolatopsis echigonensis]|uniref:Phage integrase N-terminal SAM-like domain-containing protein n=1 Tax=Amycolatopsis echigonensis TaxID=2576905 RepID=A0A8E1T3H0_9PSEU|nr:phage integrase N-terminal SAM-like domain-containing protein [Amycolatopsis echigonensis]MBB2497637.1 phage integrase N-terminal SAM-like domain-containing protein [Amycolatopsis echigonensis]
MRTSLRFLADADDPTDVGRKHVESFIAWMIQTRSASTALNKYKALQQSFNYLLDAEENDRHPMAKLSQPATTEKIIPVVGDEQLAELLETGKGKTFRDCRDMPMSRSSLVGFSDRAPSVRAGPAVLGWYRTRLPIGQLTMPASTSGIGCSSRTVMAQESAHCR